MCGAKQSHIYTNIREQADTEKKTCLTISSLQGSLANGECHVPHGVGKVTGETGYVGGWQASYQRCKVVLLTVQPK